MRKMFNQANDDSTALLSKKPIAERVDYRSGLVNFILQAKQYNPQTKHFIYVSIARQQLLIYDAFDAELLKTYTISTSANPPSFTEGSYGTPTGWHLIADKIGEGSPIGTVFKGRVSLNKTYFQMTAEEQAADLITTRILRLNGLETQNSNTFSRYIYIHGTNQESDLGTASSHGCIRIGNTDAVSLFDLIESNTPLFIALMDDKLHNDGSIG